MKKGFIGGELADNVIYRRGIKEGLRQALRAIEDYEHLFCDCPEGESEHGRLCPVHHYRKELIDKILDIEKSENSAPPEAGKKGE